jgi:hypothetical protein
MQVDIGSLPAIFGTTLLTLPVQVPYLPIDPAKSEYWAKRLTTHEANRRLPRVGLVWAGSLTPAANRRRSMKFEDLAPLACIQNVRFISLQKGEPPRNSTNAPFRLDDWTADLHDFADTAALMANLDLIVTIDTSVAHLAGALGRPVWVMLPYQCDWRWMLDRSDNPWYPTMHLFRQPTRGNWSDVVTHVTQALDDYLAKWTNP